MQITRGYRAELDLNTMQITACKKHAGAARYAYNWGLKRKQEVYQSTGRRISAMELHRELNQLKQTELSWMYEVSKAAPQEALRDLDVAFTNFFRRVRLKKEGKWKGKLGYPKFKSKKKGPGSFRLTGAIHVTERAVQLPRLGRLRLKECGYLPTKGVKILSATVSEQAGHWFVSLQVQEDVPDPVKATGEPIGVDLGIKSLAVCSDEREPIANPKALRTHFKKLIRARRRLSRRKKGGKNREKARKLLARQHSCIANIRRDALHQATSQVAHARLSHAERTALRAQLASTLPEPKTKVEARVKSKQVKRLMHQSTSVNAARRPRVIVLEDLNVSGLVKNRKLSRAISDVGMGEFRRQIAYKAVWNGEALLLADRFYPSTKRCSACGNVKAEMSLAERVYVCEQDTCQAVLDRDFNATLNLAALAR
jgi:IS605 OrfB family transposase